LVYDGGPPTINTPAAVEIACKEDVPSYEANVDDDCGVDAEYGDRDVLSTSKTKTVKGTCIDEYDVITTYSAQDECGRTATGDHTVHVVDTQNPILTNLPDDTTIECDKIPDVANVGVTDDCAYVSPHFDETSTREGYCGSPYQIYRCWWVADNCGNRDDYCQTITVQDTIAPQMLCAGAVECIHPNIECEIYPPLPPVTASDNCYEHIEIDYTATSSQGTCDHDHEEYRMWTTDDCAGGTATMTQTVTYYDKTAPVLVGHTPDVTAECPNEVPVPQVTADDNCDYALDVDFTDVEVGLYSGCAGTKTVYRQWTATDICGNTDFITQTVTITDTIAPVLTVYASHAKVECDQVASSWPGDVSAEDDCDETVTVKFRETKVDGTCPDSYTLHRSWTATDCHGNEASHLQTVFVQDTIPPYFVGSPPEDTTIPQEEVYSGQTNLPDPFQVEAEDNCADPIVDYNEVTIALDYECDYMYYRVRTWSIEDDCGNTDVMQQTIEMVRTEIPDLEEPDDVEVECDSIPAPCDVQVLGEPGYDVTITFREETEKGTCDNEYTLIRTWIATDCALNSVTSTQRVHVVDTNAPVFTRYPEDETIECGCEETGVAIIDAVDNCDLGGDEVDYTTDFSEMDCGVTEIRVWTAVDECGNVAEHSQTITIEDTTDPLFCDDFCDGEDAYNYFECDQVPLIQDPLVKDDCDSDPEVELIKDGVDISNSDCEEDKELVYEWEVRDDCGNSDKCARTITVTDTTPPLLVDNDQYCFPLTSYGPQLGEYAFYNDIEDSMQFEDNCFGASVTVSLLSCNGTQHVVPDGDDFDDTYCYFAPNGYLYVKMEANAGEHRGRFYYVWFLVSDPCGNDRIVKRTIWVPVSEFSYQDAVARGDCPHGIGPIEGYVANLPRIIS
jgi:hypothetical protein